MGRLLWQQGKYGEAEPVLQGALAGQRRTRGEDDLATLATMNSLANTYSRRGSTRKRSRSTAPSSTGDDACRARSTPTLVSMSNLAGLLRVRGRYDEAEALYTEVRDMRLRVLGAEHPDTLAAIYNVAALYQGLDRYAEAEPLYRQVLEARRRILGEDHPRTLATDYALGVLMRSLRNFPEAGPASAPCSPDGGGCSAKRTRTPSIPNSCSAGPIDARRSLRPSAPYGTCCACTTRRVYTDGSALRQRRSWARASPGYGATRPPNRCCSRDTGTGGAARQIPANEHRCSESRAPPCTASTRNRDGRRRRQSGRSSP